KDGNEKIIKSVTHELLDEYIQKDKDGNVEKDDNGNVKYKGLPTDYMDRAGILLDKSDRMFYGQGKDKDGKIINEGINKALGETDDEYTILTRKIMSSVKAGDVTLMSKPGALAMLRSIEFNVLGNPAQIAKAAELFGREAVDTMNDAIKENREKNENFYKDLAPRFDKYFLSSPAASLGINYNSANKLIMESPELQDIKNAAQERLRKIQELLRKAEEEKKKRKKKEKEEKTEKEEWESTS
ncbi:MAG: hypothetical protein PHW73_14400, partial [Atribacterota bacterium]|nr:hypothetical protein [Atribacterota bacterium]